MNRNKYRVVKLLSDGLIVLLGIHGRALWAKARSRKSGECHITGKPYASGDFIFRPFTNGNDRMKRITEEGMRKLVERS